MQCQCLILGAGILGSAIAYELSQRGVGDLHILDADLEGALSSTERNAGGVRHLWQHRVNVELAKHSIAFFEKHKQSLGFVQSGYCWLFKKGDEATGEAVLKATESVGVEYQKLGISDLKARYPFIDKTDDLAFAVFGPRDGLINTNVLKSFFRDNSKAKFHNLCAVKDLKEDDRGVEVTITRFESQEAAQKHLSDPTAPVSGTTETWRTERAVICLGAWGNELPLFRNSGLSFEPVRRQISIFKSDQFDMTPYGMVVDTSGVYFHPEGGNILAGFVVKEEPAGYNFSYDPQFFESHIWPALYERSSLMERLKHVTGWAGLYNYTPDTSGVLGRVPGCNNIFEAHSFTGRGVMQSYGAAVGLAEIMLEGSLQSFTQGALSRARFKDKSQWLAEGLHI